MQRMDTSGVNTSPSMETVSPSPEKRKAGRVQRACFNCRRRKQGCDEERPCKRCVEKGIECVEVEIKRKRGRFKSKENDHSVANDTEQTLEINNVEETLKAQGNSIQSEASSEEEEELRNACIEDHCIHHYSSPSSSNSSNSVQMEQIGSSASNKKIGLNLAHLLPFIANANCTVSSSGLEFFFADDCFDLGMDFEMQHLSNSDFSEYSANSNHMDDILESNEFEEHLKEEMLQCWRQITQQIQVDENLRQELRSVKDKWNDVLRCLRTLEWKKVQSYLEQMETPEKNYLQDSPALVFWSSGGRIHHANASFCRLIGYDVEELRVQMNGDENMCAHSLFHPDEMVHILKRQLEATQYPQRSSYYLRTRLLTKFNQDIPVSAYVTNVRDSFGGSLTVAQFAAL